MAEHTSRRYLCDWKLEVLTGSAGLRRTGHVDNLGSVDGIGLAEAIGILRDELLKARAEGAASEVQLPIESMTVELIVAASQSVDGKAGFKVPFIDVELGGGGARGRNAEQRVTVVFSGPVDKRGQPVKVAQSSNELKG